MDQMIPPDLDPTERVDLTAGSGVRAGSAATRSRPLGIIAAVLVLLVGVLWLRPSGNDGVTVAGTPSPSASAAPTPVIPPAATAGAPAQASASPAPIATDAPVTAMPEATPSPTRTARPTKTPRPPSPTPPSTFTASVQVNSQCSNEQGLQVVGIEASFAGPTDIRLVVIFVDGVEVTSVPFDAGATEGIAGTGTPVTPDVPHEATADFYGGAAGDVLVAGGVSSGPFTVELTEACPG